MCFRTYFRPLANHFSRFWRPVGKQVFSVIAAKTSFTPPESRNPLFFQKTKATAFSLCPLMCIWRSFHYLRPLWPDFGELSVWDAPALPEKEPKKSRRISIRKLSAEQKTEIEHRGLAGQRPRAIARDMGVTDCQVTSRLWRSEVAVLRQEFGVILVDFYDPAVAAENIKNWRLAKRPAWTHGGDKPREPYWWVRGRHNLPRFYTHSKSYKGLA